MEKITRRAKSLALCAGACVVGVTTTEKLAGGPPSTDLTYVLPNAKSALCFAVPLNPDFIDPWFSKKNHEDHFRNNIQTNDIGLNVVTKVIFMVFLAKP
jgi:epoxyqueuosine reductase QueG